MFNSVTQFIVLSLKDFAYRNWLFFRHIPIYLTCPRLLIIDSLLFVFRVFYSLPRLLKAYPPYLLYGEISYKGLHKLLRQLPLSSDSTLVDLGCGLGKLLFFCRSYYHFNCIGVEINATYCRVARFLKTILCYRKLSVIHADFSTITLPKGDVYVVSGTCFDEATLNILSKRFNDQGSIYVISLSTPLPNTSLDLIATETIACSWGFATVYLYH